MRRRLALREGGDGGSRLTSGCGVALARSFTAPQPKRPTLAVDLLVALALLAAVCLALFTTGCQWARVRYADRAAQLAPLLVCEPQANELVCREYARANKEDGVRLVPANSEDRTEM